MEENRKNDDTHVKREGLKYDAGKLPIYTTIFKQFPLAIKEISKCSQAGHLKYPDDKDWLNYKRVSLEENPNRYLDAALRHLDMSDGDIVNIDLQLKESGYGEVCHLAQAAWNILAHLERKLEQK
jgi:hypothetical protein